MAEAQMNAGNVELLLGGETVILKPSLEACMQLTTGADGIAGVSDRVTKMDIVAMCRVIRLGLGLGPGAVKDLEKRVYEQGLNKVREPLQVFLANIVSGGKPFDAEATAEGDTGPQEPGG